MSSARTIIMHCSHWAVANIATGWRQMGLLEFLYFSVNLRMVHIFIMPIGMIKYILLDITWKVNTWSHRVVFCKALFAKNSFFHRSVGNVKVLSNQDLKTVLSDRILTQYHPYSPVFHLIWIILTLLDHKLATVHDKRIFSKSISLTKLFGSYTNVIHLSVKQYWWDILQIQTSHR